MLLRFLYRNYPSWLFVDSQSSSNMSDANSGIQPTSSLWSHFTRKTLVPRFGFFVFRILQRRQNPYSSPVSCSDSLALGKLTHLHFLAIAHIFWFKTFSKVSTFQNSQKCLKLQRPLTTCNSQTFLSEFLWLSVTPDPHTLTSCTASWNLFRGEEIAVWRSFALV